jgi:hypothetical protein
LVAALLPGTALAQISVNPACGFNADADPKLYLLQYGGQVGSPGIDLNRIYNEAWPRSAGTDYPEVYYTNGGENATVFRERKLPQDATAWPAMVVDNLWLQQIAMRAGTSWVETAVLAHELGHVVYHHIDVAPTDQKPVWDRELEADQYAGYALAKLGATLADAQAVFRIIAPPTTPNDYNPNDHPSRDYRLAAVRKGWLAGGGQEDGTEGELSRDVSIRTTAAFPQPEFQIEGRTYRPGGWQRDIARIPISANQADLSLHDCSSPNCGWSDYQVQAGRWYYISFPSGGGPPTLSVRSQQLTLMPEGWRKMRLRLGLPN